MDYSLFTNALTLSKLPYDVAPRVHLHGMLPPLSIALISTHRYTCTCNMVK